MNEILNPYIAGAPITESSMFFGREEVFNWIERSLAGKYVDHILVLHGQRRVGKTSVLKQIPNFLGDKYIQVFFDLQGRTNTTLDRFLWWVAREIVRALTRDHGFDIPRPDRQAFADNPDFLIEEFFPTLRPQLSGKVLLLTFDEFDTLAQEEIQDALAKPLISYLRRLMDVDGLNFIFSIGSSGNKLENMQATYTDFFKAALYRKISFLDQKSCRNLITKPVEGVIDYERQAVKRIYEITTGHPYFTQLMCHELFSLCQKSGSYEISGDDVESVIEDVIERGTVNLKFVWDEASDLEKWALASLAQQEKETGNQELAKALTAQRVRFVESDLSSALIHLRDKDVLTKDNGFVIYLMRLWLMQNRPLDRVREELTEVNPIANRFIEIGDEYRSRGQIEEALDSYRRAVEAAPGYLKAQVSVAVTLYESKAYQEAVEAFEKSLQIDAVDVAAQTGLCDALLALGDQALAIEDTEQAIRHYRQVLTINQSHTDARQRLADIYRTRAEELLESGKDDEALSAFNQAVEFTPEDDQLAARYNEVLELKKAKVIAEWLKKAERSLTRQRWDESADFVEEALKLDPENQALQTKLAEVKDAPRQLKIQQYKDEAKRALSKGSFDKAISIIEMAILLAPEDASLAEWLEQTRSNHLNAQLQVFRDQAQKAIAAEDWEAAIVARKAAIKVSPDDPVLQQELAETETAKLQAQLDALTSQAQKAIQAGKWDVAKDAYKAAGKLAPDDPTWATKLEETKAAKLKAQLDAFQAQADEAVSQGDWEEAVRAVREAIKLVPNDAQWKDKLGEIETSRHQAQVDACRDRAAESRVRGDWDAAIAALEEYGKLEPADAAIPAEIEAIRAEKRKHHLVEFKSQAETAAAAENWEKAVQAWESYLALDPPDGAEVEVPLQHARKYAKIAGDYTDAENALRQKSYGRAVKLLQGVIAQDPTYKSTSRLLVEAVEAKELAPIWKSSWVFPAVGAILLVLLSVIFVPKALDLAEFLKPADTPAASTLTPAPTVHPAQAFAEPILAYVAEASPDFEEDFSTPQDYWSSYFFDSGDLLSDMVSDGAIHIESHKSGYNFQDEMISGRNFVLRYDFMSDGTAQSSQVYLSIRGSNRLNYQFALQMNGYWSIHSDGEDVYSSTIQEGNLELTSDQFYTLTLLALDDQFAIYLDDDPIAYFETTVLTGQENGLGASAILVPSLLQVDIDNIKFWNLDGVEFDAQGRLIPIPTPTPHPAQVFAEPVLAYAAEHAPTFEDDFSEINQAWGDLNEDFHISDFEIDGVLHLDLQPGDAPWSEVQLKGELLEATDFVLQFEYYVVEAGAGTNIGIDYRGENGSQEEFPWMAINASTGSLGGNYIQRIETEVGGSGQWVKVEFVAIGDQFAVYINDAPTVHYTDETYSGSFNRITLITEDERAQVDIDNIQFWNLDGVEFDVQEAFTPTEETSAFYDPILAYLYAESPTVEEDFTEVDRDVWGRHSEFNYIDAEIVSGVLQLDDSIDSGGDYAVYDKAAPGLTFPINGLFAATDFSLQFEFSFISILYPEDLIGVHFRSPYDTNYAYDQNVGYAFNISRDGTWTLRINDNTSLISEGQVTLNTLNYNTLLLIVQDQYLIIFINDEVIYETTDLEASEASGRFTEIAVYSEDVSSGTSMFKFDDLKYWDLDGVEFDTQETPTPTPTPTEETVTTSLDIGSAQVSPVDGMTMVYVPEGEFKMGSEDGEPEEAPVHTVYLDAFWIDQTEVTYGQFQQFMEKTSYPANPSGDGANYPVANVDWRDAAAYCKWAGRRLPTEAEWEKAARGGLKRKTYPWGDEDPVCTAGAENGAQFSNCGDGAGDDAVPVKTFAFNGYGLYDMAGNLWEWVADWYDNGYYNNSPYGNPSGPSTGDSRVIRGGSWLNDVNYVRSAARLSLYSSSMSDIGFRCAQSEVEP